MSGAGASEVVAPARSRLNLRWLVRLRWAAVVAQLTLTLLITLAIKVPLPLGRILLVILLLAASNVALEIAERRGHPGGEPFFASVLLFDIVLLTLLLWLGGGPMNPMSALYLVHVALSSVVLSATATTLMVICTLVGYALLFFLPTVNVLNHVEHHLHMDLHLKGMWVAFAVAAVLITVFVGRLQRQVRNLEKAAESTRRAREQSRHLASLATLAAGAAHELSTPLSIIAVAAKELERELAAGIAGAESDDLAEEAHIIREEVKRCRDVMSRLTADAGDIMGEQTSLVSLRELLDDVVSRHDANINIRIDERLDDRMVAIPREAVTAALRNLVSNAVDASKDGGEIAIRAGWQGGMVILQVQDKGSGMDAVTLERVGEPFFTSKEPGQGMGLGVFYARGVFESLGGGIYLASTPGKGTQVTVRIPGQLVRRAPDEAAAEAPPDIEDLSDVVVG
ncbi:HAMP domain-containing histidine kinase [bacterium]|nr:HAMP domain-containing histidine kinase [bacterium]